VIKRAFIVEHASYLVISCGISSRKPST